MQLASVPGRPPHGPEPVKEVVLGTATTLVWPFEASAATPAAAAASEGKPAAGKGKKLAVTAVSSCGARLGSGVYCAVTVGRAVAVVCEVSHCATPW